MDKIFTLLNEICLRSFMAGLGAGAIVVMVVCRKLLMNYKRKAEEKTLSTIRQINIQVNTLKQSQQEIEANVNAIAELSQDLSQPAPDKPYRK